MANPRTIAFFFNLLLLLVILCSFLIQFVSILSEDGKEAEDDNVISLINFPILPSGFLKTPDVCRADPDEPHNVVNLIASMSGFRPIVRTGVIFITLTGLLYYIVELTYLPFIMVAVDLLVTTMSTIFYIYKHSDAIFQTPRDCIVIASFRLFESSVVLTNFVILALACLYIVGLHQCRVVVETNSRQFKFVQGSRRTLKRINKMAGYETRRAKSRRSRRKSRRSSSRKSGSGSTRSQSGSVRSHASKRSHSRSASSRSASSRSSRSTRSSRSDPIARSTRSSSVSRSKPYPYC